MAKILCLETATTNCSVCISMDGKPVVVKEQNTQSYTHSEQLHVYISEVLKEASLKFSDLDAIAVSKGPGSYTGLRIGVSAAKGLCFSLDIPLISIPTLEVLANQFKAKGNEVIIPLLDARRMEVYSAVYNSDLKEIRETRAEVIDESSFSDYGNFSRVYLIGNGAEKCKEIVKLANTDVDASRYPSSNEMAQLAFRKYNKADYEDVAYFEPYYLKDFILGGKKS